MEKVNNNVSPQKSNTIKFVLVALISLLLLTCFVIIWKNPTKEESIFIKDELYKNNDCSNRNAPYKACYCSCVDSSNTQVEYKECVKKSKCNFIN